MKDEIEKIVDEAEAKARLLTRHIEHLQEKRWCVGCESWVQDSVCLACWWPTISRQEKEGADKIAQ